MTQGRKQDQFLIGMSRWKLSKMLLPLLKNSYLIQRKLYTVKDTVVVLFPNLYIDTMTFLNTLKICYIIESWYNKHFNIDSYSVQLNVYIAFGTV